MFIFCAMASIHKYTPLRVRKVGSVVQLSVYFSPLSWFIEMVKLIALDLGYCISIYLCSHL